MSNTHRR